MFLYDKTNILEGSGTFEVDFALSHGPANIIWVPPLDDIILAQSLSINIMWMS